MIFKHTCVSVLYTLGRYPVATCPSPPVSVYSTSAWWELINTEKTDKTKTDKNDKKRCNAATGMRAPSETVSVIGHSMWVTDTPEGIITMLISVIVQEFDSVSTLNLLARTSKSLNVTVSDPRLVAMVVKNTPAMTKGALRKLFVLPRNVPLSFIMMPCPRQVLRSSARCAVDVAFQRAMITHEGVCGMQQAFHARQLRSVAMKRSLVRKKEALALLWQARRRDIEQIHEDLFLVPSKAHVCTDAEMYYTAFGLVKRLSSVYRDKRFMLIHNTGLHTLPWRKGVNNFMRVARVDMTAPETLTHGERLFMLRHNIAWEHYLVNYTNFTTLLESVEDVITDIDHIEFLYPLPARWPWIVQGNATQPHNATQPPHVEPVQNFQVGEIHARWQLWLDEHAVLYETPHPAGP